MLHQNGDPTLEDLTWESRVWDGEQAYSDSKLHDVLLAFGMARRWLWSPLALECTGAACWVPTKMGGPEATDDLNQAHRTQVWLAASDDPEALVTGEYFYHLRKKGAPFQLPTTLPGKTGSSQSASASQRYRLGARVASLIRISLVT